jgi:hypothetical protein
MRNEVCVNIQWNIDIDSHIIILGAAYAATVASRDMEFTQMNTFLGDMSRERLAYDVMGHGEVSTHCLPLKKEIY